jgi:fatty-acid desaturase
LAYSTTLPVPPRPRVHTTPPGHFHLSDIVWINVFALASMHLGALAAPFFFTPSALIVAVLGWWIFGGLGICLCYHRLLTHRSFRTPKVVEYTLAILGCLTWQGGPIRWVGAHRIHHKESDGPGDPHSPRRGFFWAHMGWLFQPDPPGIDITDAARDLKRDPVLVFIDRWHWAFMIPLAVAFYLIGGLPWLLWGICVRTAFTNNATFLVNSASHLWGYRKFETKDDSKNSWWVALLTFGEGWHNNHHAHQRSARHGFAWWEIDLTYAMIRLMALVGLARDVVVPARAVLRGERPVESSARG